MENKSMNKQAFVSTLAGAAMHYAATKNRHARTIYDVAKKGYKGLSPENKRAIIRAKNELDNQATSAILNKARSIYNERMKSRQNQEENQGYSKTYRENHQL